MPQTSEKFLRPIEDIAETLRNAKERGTKCSVLIGAGCSVTADIPTAQGFVEVIKKKYPIKYDRAEPKTYPNCMGELSVSEQRALIAEYVDKSKINWGHIALAQLIKEGYVDRVLTTNFDSLVVRACALLGIFPAVYDFASSQNFEADKIPGRAVFYLHGQRTGFVLMNEEKILKKQAELLAPVFTDAGLGRVWIAVGYSGENDPVFSHLANVKRFDNNLYWIGYRDNEPAKHVHDSLLSEEIDKDAYYVKGFDSDSFFVTLAQQLGCFPPEFVSKPFSYLDELFNQLTEYTLPKTDSPIDALKNARSYVHEAIETIESASSDVLEASSNLLSGEYEKVVELQPSNVEEVDPKLSESLAWAYFGQGNEIYYQALTNTGADAERLYKQAIEKYISALKVNPQFHEALNNWGLALSGWAKTKTGVEADSLFQQAGEKYEAALKINPHYHVALGNWGAALFERAKTKTGVEADNLLQQAREKSEAALKIEPDFHEALNNWGAALSGWARTKTGVEADSLFRQAAEKYEAALKIKPDFHLALSNWGNALSGWAKTKTGVEADSLFRQAGEKYEAALKIKPDFVDALSNWGAALFDWAKTKSGIEADSLFGQAAEKHEAALEIMPDDHETLNNLGSMLITWAQTKDKEKREELYKKAKDILVKADNIKEGIGSYNLACLCALRSLENECCEWLIRSKQFGYLPPRQHLEQDTDLNSIKNKKWFMKFLETL